MFTAAEADPLIKVGGLGDVTGSLPHALRALPPETDEYGSLDVRLVIPFHSAIRDRINSPEKIAEFEISHNGGAVSAQVYQTQVGELPVYLVDGAPFQSAKTVYSPNTEEDGEKYAFFSLAALEMARVLHWQPDILHAHDWHSALSARMLAHYRALRDPFFHRTRSALTIHNLPFMGAGTDRALHAYHIPPVEEPRMPPWGMYQPLPMGMATADAITTVSPSYAVEIRTCEYGCGLENFLQCRAQDLYGILNGLDLDAWNPETDPALPATFDANRIDQRLANKTALAHEVGLTPRLDQPLLILISRMDYQKGVDLAIGALRELSALPWQAVLLGTGDPILEDAMRRLEADFPDRVRAIVRFDAQLARRMYGAGDIVLMPSRYEPCGTTQMVAMHYGCLPVARSTGGLRDTIQDADDPGASTGFLFQEATSGALAGALRRALAAWNETAGWQARQRCAMRQDFSWQRSTREYTALYRQLVRAG